MTSKTKKSAKTKSTRAGAAHTTDAYIAAFPPAVQKVLQQLRAAIKRAAPEATEKISYGMPAFELHGNLVYFAGYRQHIGFYATPTGHAAFAKELARYKTGKGSVQFPLAEPLPIRLIEKMIRFRVKENLAKRTGAARKAAPAPKRGARVSVDDFLERAKHPHTPAIQLLRKAILGCEKDISEEIKWNAPSFIYAGDNRLTFRLQPGNRVELILHRGSRPKPLGKFQFPDDSGLIRWVAPDRGQIVIAGLADAKKKLATITGIARRWFAANREK